MASISQDDEVQYLFHMTMSLLHPLRSIEAYEQKVDENYWRSLWAIVSYVKTGNFSEASLKLPVLTYDTIAHNERQ